MAAILADVQQRGDAAVLDYTARFDGLAAASVAALELTRGRASRPPSTACQPTSASALQAATRRVRSYHEAPAAGQRPELELPR